MTPTLTRRSLLLAAPALVAAVAGCGGAGGGGGSSPNPDLQVPETGKRPPRNSPAVADSKKK